MARVGCANVFRPSVKMPNVKSLRHPQPKPDRSHERSLRPNGNWVMQLQARLQAANDKNGEFGGQYESLVALVRQALSRLEAEFELQIDRVHAVGGWAESGVDLREAACEDLLLEIILRSEERPFDFYYRLADKVFSDLQESDVFLQFRLTTAGEWHYAQSTAKTGNYSSSGITLLSRD
jgi:hypothetical protein